MIQQGTVADLTGYSCSGWCRDCQTEHRLPFGSAVAQAHAVMAEFEKLGRLDYLKTDSESDPECRFEKIFSGNRGHMFGVMECLDADGQTIWLRAFSSLHGGLRDVEGWVPSILPPADFEDIVLPGQKHIKELTRKKNEAESESEAAEIEALRKGFSRELMRKIHDLYFFENFKGERRPLREVFAGEGGIPGGAGDCCAPKLLNHAAKNGLLPVSVAEFYWGGPNRSGRKKPGQFFAACEDKCQPILGFMLCGMNR